MKLDLGCGSSPAEGYEGVDRYSLGQDHRVHLWSGQRWPWATSSVEALRASHVIEHIAKGEVPLWGDWPLEDPWIGETQDRLFFFFDEAYRVIVAGGRFELSWPQWGTVFADMDPTHHRNIPLEMLHYLSVKGRELLGVTSYRVRCDWELEGNVTEGLVNGKPFDWRLTLVARKDVR